MSETTEPTPDATPATEPTPAPVATPGSTSESDEQEPQHEAKAPEKEDRRIAQLRARLGAAEREQEQQRAELEFYRRQAQQRAPAEETPEQRYQRERAEIRAQVEFDIKAERFHEEGYAKYPEWGQMREDLIKMGADAGMARLLIEMPGGVQVAAALAEDPAQLQRIAGIPSERGRAIALGKYAAGIESEAPARPAPQLTRAPAPIRPVTGRAAPQFNEYTASGQELVDRYMRQDLESRMRR